MTIDEAIKHCEEKAKELSDKAYEEWGKSMSEEEAYNCNECAREHAQLAEWLKELKALKENNGDLISRSEAEKLGATCLARRNENGQLEAIISLENAPTVAVNCKDCDGYEAGYSAGVRDTERPQGEIFPMEIVAGKCPIEAGGNCPLKSQGECENCDYRKFSAAIIDNIVDMMNKLEIDNLDDLRKLIEEMEASI